jgi:hypothetical protein
MLFAGQYDVTRGQAMRAPSRLDKTAFPELMKKIGVWIEDTDFNRRASEYAAHAHVLHNAAKTNQKQRLKKSSKV